MMKVVVVVGKKDNRYVGVYATQEAADYFIQRSHRYAPDGVTGYDEYATAEATVWTRDGLEDAFNEAQR
jgi:hypothetical protein